MKNILRSLCLLGLLGSTAPTAFAQSPWVAAPTIPWMVGQPFASTDIYSVQLTGPTNVWMVMTQTFAQGFTETYAYVSADEGQTWNRNIIAQGKYSSGTLFRDCWTLDGQLAWAIISRYGAAGPLIDLLKSTTGAAGFASVTVPGGNNLGFVRSFSGSVALAAVESGGAATWPFLRSTNSGLTWAPVSQAPAAEATDLLGACILLGNHLWIATKNGNVLHTADQGQTWQTSATGLGTDLKGLVFRDAQHGLAYGNGRLQRTTDSGQTWTAVPYAGPARTACVVAVPGTAANYLSVGDGTASIDDGTTWLDRENNSLRHQIVAASSSTRAWTDLKAAIGSQSGSVGHYSGNILSAYQAAQDVVGLYPNPTSDVLYLPATGRYQQAVIYDVLGRKCLAATLALKGSKVSLAPFGSGTFQVVLTGPTAHQASRVVVIP